MRNSQQKNSDGELVQGSPTIEQTSSLGLDFTNYFETGQIYIHLKQGTYTNLNDYHRNYSDTED